MTTKRLRNGQKFMPYDKVRQLLYPVFMRSYNTRQRYIIVHLAYETLCLPMARH